MATSDANGPARPARRQRMPRADRERQMMTVAEEVFAERGYVAASMDEIAERVGVSKPMLYEYFGSKEGLLAACIRQARAELLKATSQAALEASTPEQMLRRGLVAYFEFVRTEGKARAMLRTEAAVASPSAAAEIEACRAQQTEFISSTMAIYAPLPATVNATATAEIIVGGCERLAQWCERNPDVSPEQAAELVMHLTWVGLGQLVQQAPTGSPAVPPGQ